MSAGAVRAPLIIPLRFPTDGITKSHIDTKTRLELVSETPNVDIYFTINGSRPTVKKNERELVNNGTFKFRTPFTLPPGSQTVRAVAFCPNTGRESNIVTKTFGVAKSTQSDACGSSPVPDDYGFLEDLKNIEYHRRKYSKSNDHPEKLRIINELLKEEDGINDDRALKPVNGVTGRSDYQASVKKHRTKVKQNGKVSKQHQQELPQTSPQHSSRKDIATVGLMHAFNASDHHLTRLQQITSLLSFIWSRPISSCPNCFQARPTDADQNFCLACGHRLPRLPTPQLPVQVGQTRLGPCQTCGAHVPLQLPNCLVCESPNRPSTAAAAQVCPSAPIIKVFGDSHRLRSSSRHIGSRPCLLRNFYQKYDCEWLSACDHLVWAQRDDRKNESRQEVFVPKTTAISTNCLAAREFRVCSVCHTLNPVSSTSCLTCEAHLPAGYRNIVRPPQAQRYGQEVGDPAVVTSRPASSVPSPPPPPGSAVTLSCPHCHQKITPTARFCGWCGLEAPTGLRQPPGVYPQSRRDQDTAREPLLLLQQQMSATGLQCHTCGLPVSSPSANFCSCCGSRLAAPAPAPPPAGHFMSWLTETPLPYGKFYQSTQDSSRLSSTRPPETRHEDSPASGKSSDAVTQTVGIYYPSSASLRNQTRWPMTEARPASSGGTGEFDRQNLRHNRARCPTGISPGKGFWRKQLEHLTTHLKIYTSNNPSFRAAIGEPRFGQLIMADLKQTATQAVIYLTYALPASFQPDPAGSLTPRAPLGCRRGRSKRNGSESVVASVARGDSSYRETASDYDENENDENLASDCEDSELFPEQGTRSGQSGKGESVSKDYSLNGVDRLQLSNRSSRRRPIKSPSSINRSLLERTTGGDQSDRALYSSRSSLSSNTVTSGGKQSARKGRKTVSGKPTPASRSHHGQAGVALQRESKLSANDRRLFSFLSHPVDPLTGETESDEIEVRRLLAEGADPNCINGDGETPIISAVRSRRALAIPILVSNGAKINAKASTQVGNTALHEAVLSGDNGVPLAQSLLKCGANSKVKNGRDQTAYALALQTQCDALVRLFVTHWGEQELHKLTSEAASLAIAQPQEDANL